MKRWLILAVIFIAGILQSTFLDSFKVFNVKPDLLLVTAVLVSLTLNWKWALALSTLAGLLKDIFSFNPFGINTLFFPLWSILILRLSRKISLEHNFIRMPLIFIIVIFNDIIIRLIFISLGEFIPLGIFLRTVFLESLYTAAMLPLVFRVIRPLLYFP